MADAVNKKMPIELLKCPCGETPKKLGLVENGNGCKYASVYGDCCGEWNIEFRTGYKSLDSIECMELAVKAWNDSPRGNLG